MDKFLEYLQNEDLLIKPATLVAGIVGILGFLAAIDGIIKELLISGVNKRLSLYLILVISWVGFWLHKKYVFPRSAKDKIGIVIAITTESNKEKIRLKNDFIKRMNELIDANHLDSLLNIVLLKNYQAERVVPIFTKYQVQLNRYLNNKIPVESEVSKQRMKLQNTLRGVFYVWGSIVEREGDTYYLETDVIVYHGKIDPEAQQRIAADITSIWSPKFSFKEKAEYQGFRFSAEFIYLAARYIIGEAAFVVNQFGVALRLHETLEEELELLHGHPNIGLIRQRLNGLLAEEYSIVAYLNHYLKGEFAEAKKLIEQCLKHDPRYYDAYIQKAAIEFSHERNPGKALQTIHAAKSVAGTDGTWRYSEGFLLMYLEHFRKALAVYRKIAMYSYKGEEGTLEQIYAFNIGQLEKEPEKIQSLFILGFLKYKKDKNYPEALDYFEQFLQRVEDQPKYKLLIGEATQYKSQLEQIMGLGK